MIEDSEYCEVIQLERAVGIYTARIGARPDMDFQTAMMHVRRGKAVLRAGDASSDGSVSFIAHDARGFYFASCGIHGSALSGYKPDPETDKWGSVCVGTLFSMADFQATDWVLVAVPAQMSRYYGLLDEAYEEDQ